METYLADKVSLSSGELVEIGMSDLDGLRRDAVTLTTAAARSCRRDSRSATLLCVLMSSEASRMAAPALCRSPSSKIALMAVACASRSLVSRARRASAM